MAPLERQKRRTRRTKREHSRRNVPHRLGTVGHIFFEASERQSLGTASNRMRRRALVAANEKGHRLSAGAPYVRPSVACSVPTRPGERLPLAGLWGPWKRRN